MMNNHRFGWAGKISTFLVIQEHDFIDALRKQLTELLNLPINVGQLRAWSSSLQSLKITLSQLIDLKQDAGDWHIIFEYILPRENGRRPDVIILSPEQIFILEYKDFNQPLRAHIDQVSAYALDIQNYQSKSHDNPVVPILVVNKGREVFCQDEDVWILSPEKIAYKINEILVNDKYPIIKFDEWIQGEYSPLPTLVSAARDLFNHEPLPNIHKAQSAGIPETIRKLIEISRIAKENNEHHLVLITGVPGSGKTLVGLKFVYSSQLNLNNGESVLYLSGNKTLVEVLQHAFDNNRVFVQSVKNYLREYGGENRSIVNENIIVFDEAQRAWDQTQAKTIRTGAKTESEDFLDIGNQKNWFVLVGLIGEGQEINKGEETGLPLWDEALKKVGGEWVIDCPSKISSAFPSASKVSTYNELNLDKTLRSHLADDLHSWVSMVLDNRLIEAREKAGIIHSSNFDFYITRDINFAKNYVRNRYYDEVDKRYGLLASSKATNLVPLKIYNEYQYTKTFSPGPWYNNQKNDPKSCCQLKEVVTEFSCQGLELDFPIVCWGNDLYWDKDGNLISITKFRPNVKNPRQITLNSYRVLLTRGRDGFIIFIPQIELLDATYNKLQEAGLRELPI